MASQFRLYVASVASVAVHDGNAVKLMVESL